MCKSKKLLVDLYRCSFVSSSVVQCYERPRMLVSFRLVLLFLHPSQSCSSKLLLSFTQNLGPRRGAIPHSTLSKLLFATFVPRDLLIVPFPTFNITGIGNPRSQRSRKAYAPTITPWCPLDRLSWHNHGVGSVSYDARQPECEKSCITGATQLCNPLANILAW